VKLKLVQLQGEGPQGDTKFWSPAIGVPRTRHRSSSSCIEIPYSPTVGIDGLSQRASSTAPSRASFPSRPAPPSGKTIRDSQVPRYHE
jgi:hypothetical protein